MPGINSGRKETGLHGWIIFGDGTGFRFSAFHLEKRGPAAAVQKGTRHPDFPFQKMFLNIQPMGFQGLLKNRASFESRRDLVNRG